MSLRIVRWVALLAELLSTESLGSACRVLFVGLMRPCIAPKTGGVKGALISGVVCSGLIGVGGRGSGCENIGNRVACSGSITNRSVTNRSVVTKSGERVFEIFIVAKSIKIFLEPALS